MRSLLTNTLSESGTLRQNNLVLELDNMSKLAEKCNIQVTVEALNLIDDGKNPDEFTRDILNNYIVKNQITKGKTDAFKVEFFFSPLLFHLFFPEVTIFVFSARAS